MRRALLMLFAAGGLVVAGCSSGSSTAAPSSASSSTSASSTASSSASASSALVSSASSSGSPAAASGATVSVATDPKLGQILVGPDGRTLYLFAVETGTTSMCTAGCAPTWPALAASGTPTGGSGVDASKLGTANGQVANQVTYNGHLLYYFAGDSKPGDVHGTSIPQWYAVTPAGGEAGE